MKRCYGKRSIGTTSEKRKLATDYKEIKIRQDICKEIKTNVVGFCSLIYEDTKMPKIESFRCVYVSKRLTPIKIKEKKI